LEKPLATFDNVYRHGQKTANNVPGCDNRAAARVATALDSEKTSTEGRE